MALPTSPYERGDDKLAQKYHDAKNVLAKANEKTKATFSEAKKMANNVFTIVRNDSEKMIKATEKIARQEPIALIGIAVLASAIIGLFFKRR